MDIPINDMMPSYPTLQVSDLKHSTRWYCDIFGFSLVFQMPGPGGQPFMSHLRWAPHADLILRSEGAGTVTPEPRGAGITLTFTALRESVDTIAKRARDQGVVQISGPHNRPWNACEIIVLDPDGYRLNFTEILRHPLSGEELMAQIQELLEEGALN